MGDVADYTIQPRPVEVEGAVSSHDLAIADLASWEQPEMTLGVIAKLRERKAFGLGKYNVILHKDNARNVRKDALDEAIDLVVYLRTWCDQEPGRGRLLEPLYQDALWIAVVLTAELAGEEPPGRWAKHQAPLTRIEDLREQLEMEAHVR